MQIKPVFSLPVCAAVSRGDLDRAAHDLDSMGHQLTHLEGSWWRGEHWEKATPAQAVESLQAERRVRVQSKQGEVLEVASQEDLVEASALVGKGPVSGLGSPVLAGSLRVLGEKGRFLVDGQPSNSYVAYNALTADPNHPSGPLEFEASGVKMALKRPEDALTAAYLQAGFGDGKGVDPKAIRLVSLASQGISFSNGSAFAAYLAPARACVDGVDLGDPLQSDLSAKLQDYEVARGVLKADTASWWPLLQAASDRSIEERASLAATVGQQDYYRTVLDSAAAQEKLADAAAPLQDVLGALPPRSPEVVLAYQALRALPADQKGDYLGRLRTCQDASLASIALQDPDLAGLMDELSALKAPEARGLLRAAVASGPVAEQRELLLAASAYPDSTRLYQGWAQAMPPECRGEFLALLKDEPDLERAQGAWNALVLDSPRLAERRQAWAYLRGQLQPAETASEQASAILSGMVCEHPVEAAQVYVRMLASGKVSPEQVSTTFARLQESSDPSAALELYLISGNAEQAVSTSRWLTRKALPAGHDEALVALARAHEGNLEQATRDLLFLASRQPAELSEAAGMMSDLLGATGSSREARLAFSALEAMDPAVGAPRSESLMRALRLTQSYAAAQPIWESLCALSPEEGKKRLLGLSPDAGLPPGAQSRILAGQLRAPLDPKALANLQKLLERPSLLMWKGGEGWTETEGVWSYAGPFHRDGGPCLESSVIRLPEGDCSLTWDGAWKLPDKASFGLEIAAENSDTWTSLNWRQGTGEGPSEPISLLGWEGKSVRFRLRTYLYEGSGQGSFEFRGMKLSERKTGPIQTVDLSTWTQQTIGDDIDTTSPWVQLDASSPSELKADVQLILRNAGNYAQLAIQGENDSDFKAIKHYRHASDYDWDRSTIDMAAYQGKKVRFRYRLHAPIKGTASYNTPSINMSPPTLLPVRQDQTGAARLELYCPGGLDQARTDQVLSMAYGDGDAARRGLALQTLARLRETTGSFDASFRVWDKMQDDLGKPDFEDRAVAYASLFSKGTEADELFALVERERAPGEKLEFSARILAGRSVESWRALRRRVGAEGLGQPVGASMEFLAGLGSHAELLDRAWETVSTPVLSESLGEREAGFTRLSKACGSLDAALAVYGQIGQWLEPGDTLPSAVDAVAQLAGLLGRDQSQIQAALKFIQENQQRGTLSGQTLSGIVERLANVLVVRETRPGSLEEALQELLIPVVGPGGVSEQADKVIVGGIQVPKKG